MSTRVVITGMGTVGPGGCGRPGLAQALRESTPLASLVDRSGGYHRPDSARTAAQVDASELRQWVPGRTARRMSPSSRYSVGAARMAWADSGHDEGALGRRRMTVSMATCLGPASLCERILRELNDSGPEATSPFLFAESVANAPAAQIAIAFGAREGNFTFTQREAGALIAVLRGVAEVESGRADMALVGSVDEYDALSHAVLDRFGALAVARDGEEEVARPFDRGRAGFLMGDGATVLLLEREEDALRNNTRILARIRGGGQANDPSATATSWGRDHQGLSRSMAASMRRLSLQPGEIQRIVSGASGAVTGDRLEALTLQALWGEETLPPILAPKAVTGEYGGGYLASLLLAMEGATFGPTAGFRGLDPLLGIVPHDGRPLDAPRSVLGCTHASGGAAAWLFLERA